MRVTTGMVATVVLASLASSVVYADVPHAKHTIFGEFLGAGLGFTANYERRVYPWLGLRAGLGYSFSTGAGEGDYGNFVASAHALHRLRGAHHLEASPGFGALTELGGDRRATITSLLVGYRYQRPGGLFARVQLGLGILSRTDKDTKTLPLFGIAVGWSL